VTSKKDFDRLRSQLYTQEREQAVLAERIEKLEADLARAQPAQANNWAELNAMRSQLASVEGQLDDIRRTQDMQRSSADGLVTIDTLSARVRELERKSLFMASQVGVVFDEMPGLPETQNATNGTAPMVPPAGQPTGQPAAQPATQPATRPADAAPATPQPEPEPQEELQGQELYQKALESFYAMKYKQAQTTWAEFVKGFPKDPLVPNAIFWQGECFFQMQDYANAVLTYQQVIEKHAKSNKYRPALLKQGISFFKLEKDQAGKLVLEDLIKKFPDSAEAKRAQAYLKESN
jgi:tol-pal system protein YbgF